MRRCNGPTGSRKHPLDRRRAGGHPCCLRQIGAAPLFFPPDDEIKDHRMRARDRAAAWLVLSVAAAGLSPGDVRAVPGDSFEDPFLVGALPFLATGTTCGFADDIVLPCSSSPEGGVDVVYRYVADRDQVVTISTCGSSYLGTFTVFDGTGGIVSCAPTYCLNGGYASQVELIGGSTYDIVLDSESASPCGGYILSIDECAGPLYCDPVIVRCPPGALEEVVPPAPSPAPART
jgi:hypothetical protein